LKKDLFFEMEVGKKPRTWKVFLNLPGLLYARVGDGFPTWQVFLNLPGFLYARLGMES